MVFIVGALCVQRYLLSFAAVRVDAATLDFLTRRLLALPMSYFATRRTGDIQRRLEGMRQVREFLVQHGVGGAHRQPCSSSRPLALMFVYSPRLTLVFLATAPLYAAHDVLLVARCCGRCFDELEEAYGRYQSHQIDAIKGIETVKAMGAERPFRELMLGQFHARVAASASRPTSR